MASNLFWHVPRWYDGPPAYNLGQPNVDKDIVIELLETETASNNIAPDSYFVERIVGQYQLTGGANAGEDPAIDAFVHHRVYATQANVSDLALRDLGSADEADSRWLMHKVEFFNVNASTDKKEGNWSNAPAGSGPSDTFAGSVSRKGGFDIRAGIAVREGFSLIWHTQLEASATPFDNTMYLKMWVRLLLKKM